MTQVENRFEETYLALRRKEGRIYSDEEVKSLPTVDSSHPYFAEWKIRKRSCNNLTRYLRNKKQSLKILEVGCGNGWLSCQLSKIGDSKVTGIDINKTELRQAQRIFGEIDNLEFLMGEITDERIQSRKFDIIIFAASIQYFPSLDPTISSCLQILNANGEIHILDSHFYSDFRTVAARNRSEEYFQSMGFSQMTEHYFHHEVEQLNNYNFKMLHNPSWIRRVFRIGKNPFPWVCIMKRY
jgi:ubiquinone/menaquinone biosynthesis C-methylase UbiE